MDEDRPAPRNEAELDHSVRARTARERYRTELAVRSHSFVVDEPPALGGSDLGPTPFDLLASALASCTTITLRMYADRKEWPLEEVAARAEYRRERASPDDPPRHFFDVQLDLSGDLDDAQRARLVEIAAKCPVHKLLVTGATVVVGEASS